MVAVCYTIFKGRRKRRRRGAGVGALGGVAPLPPVAEAGQAASDALLRLLAHERRRRRLHAANDFLKHTHN